MIDKAIKMLEDRVNLNKTRVTPRPSDDWNRAYYSALRAETKFMTHVIAELKRGADGYLNYDDAKAEADRMVTEEGFAAGDEILFETEDKKYRGTITRFDSTGDIALVQSEEADAFVWVPLKVAQKI